MFFEVPEIQELNKSIATLQSSLQTTILPFLPYLSLVPTYHTLHTDTTNLFLALKQIVQTIEYGFVLPETLSQQLYEEHSLPQWFSFVLAKEYTAKKEQLLLQAKKILRLSAVQTYMVAVERALERYKTLITRQEAIGKELFDLIEQTSTLIKAANLARKHVKVLCENITQLIVKFVTDLIKKANVFKSGNDSGTIEDIKEKRDKRVQYAMSEIQKRDNEQLYGRRTQSNYRYVPLQNNLYDSTFINQNLRQKSTFESAFKHCPTTQHYLSRTGALYALQKRSMLGNIAKGFSNSISDFYY